MHQATDLLTPSRFDIAAKHIYARWHDKKQKSDWGRIVYDNHMLAINGGLETRSDTLNPTKDYPKVGLDDFYSKYNSLLASIKQDGFKADHAVPVRHDGVVLDGAHRVASCIYYHTPITINPISNNEHKHSCNYSYAYFDSAGLDADTLDFMVLEYITLCTDCHLLLIWPSAQKYLEKIRAMVTENAQLVCEKKIRITNKQMPLNIVQQVYAGEEWLVDKYGMQSGGQSKADLCFKHGNTTHAILLRAKSNNRVVELKENIRKLAGMDKHAAHSTENQQQTFKLASLFFNRNSLHYLHYASPFPSLGFWERLTAYQQALPINSEDFCIHGSSVLEAYGIREACDLDYVSRSDIQLSLSAKDISLSNEKPEWAGMSVEQTIEDPRNYFYYHGMKFASLPVVMNMKQQRGEQKDRHDVRMIKFHTHKMSDENNLLFALWQAITLRYKRRKIRRKIKARRRLEKLTKK